MFVKLLVPQCILSMVLIALLNPHLVLNTEKLLVTQLVLVFVLVALLNAHLVRTTEKFEDSPLAPCASPRSDWPTASLLAPSEEKNSSYLIRNLQREYLTITITCCCSRALAVTSLAIRLNPLPLPFPMSMLTFTIFSDIFFIFSLLLLDPSPTGCTIG